MTSVVVLYVKASGDILGARSGVIRVMISLVCYLESYSLGSAVDRNGHGPHPVEASISSANHSIARIWASKLASKLTVFLVEIFRQVK